MRFLSTVIVFYLFLPSIFSVAQSQEINWSKVNVLVYTKNGKGYVHENIPAAVSCIQKLAKQYRFKVDTSADASVMTKDNLKKYTLLIFTSTNNDVFDTDAQRLAFRHYIEAGGGFVGVHSVTGTERNWKWFKMMIGGTFSWHAKFQKFTVKVIDPSHPSVQGLPKVWQKEDECYFEKELYPGIKTILAHDITTLNTSDTTERSLVIKNAGGFGDLYPAAWTNDFDGGYIWITALGHDRKDYEDPVYVQHLFQGIRYIAGKVKRQDYTKAYADNRDTAVRY
jgi:type 1 glutamine amidotransferase